MNDSNDLFIKEERMKDKLSKIDETKFRSDYQNFTKLEKLEQILDYQKINPENNNLIRFINENKDIHKISLKKIVQFDSNKLFKAVTDILSNFCSSLAKSHLTSASFL